jgi:hypothetical protein
MAQDAVSRSYTNNNILGNIADLTSYTDTQLLLRANIASPALTGTPTAPTAAAGVATTQLATTAYVMAQDSVRRSYVDTNILGNIAALTSSTNNSISLKASIESPTLTGTPQSVTAAAGDNSTKIATTAFVQGEIASGALWQGSHKFVSTVAPTSAAGVDGDFWFQYQ